MARSRGLNRAGRLGAFLDRLLWAALGLMPAALGAALIAYLRPEADPLLIRFLVGLAAAAGLYAAVHSWRAGRLAARAAALDAECRDLAQKCMTYLARARAAEGKVESLSLIREIHRTGNIAGRPERFRGLLAVLAQTAEASQADLFTPEGRDASPALAASLRRLADGEFFAYFERPPAGSRTDASELVCRKAEEVVSGARAVIRAEVWLGKDAIGFAELSLVRRGGPRSSVPTAREMIEAQVRTLELEAAGADQALEHRQVFRVHDQAHSALALSYPLMAEGAITGAMRLAVPDEVLARRELAELEEVLQETAGHVGLVVKKDEDVERARHDGLTGLFLKAELLRDLRRELEAAARAGGKLALLMIDIDHFKRVNDAHGHLTGDVVLKGVAGCLAAHVRGEDRAYRYGGEEMAVLLPGADEAAAARTAERLRRAVAELEFHADDGAAVPVTISVGLTNGAQAAADPDEFITRADQALYFSKESGRDRCSRWRPGGPEELPRSGRSGRNPRGRAATPAPRESRAP